MERQNQLTAATVDGSEVDYAYDPFGRMVSRNPVGGTAQNFVYDGQEMVLVLDGNGQVVERELYGPAVDQILATETVTPGSAPQAAGQVNWLLTDNQGTVRDVAHFDGTTTSVVDHIIYDCFGQITSQTTPANQPTFTYDGMWQDPTSKLDYDDARWYDPANGVFRASDPIEFNGGDTNLYRFCGNSPTNYTDPSGLELIIVGAGATYNLPGGISPSASTGMVIDIKTGQVKPFSNMDVSWGGGVGGMAGILLGLSNAQSVSQYKGLTLDYSGWAGDGPAGGVFVSHGNGATSVSGLLGGGAGWGLSVGGGYSHVGLLDASTGSLPVITITPPSWIPSTKQPQATGSNPQGAGRGTALGNRLGNPSYQSCLNQLNDRCPKPPPGPQPPACHE